MLLRRAINAIADPNSIWRELFRFGYLSKEKDPKEWFMFRLAIKRECALRRHPEGGLQQRLVEGLFPEISKLKSEIVFLRPHPYHVSWEEMITLTQLVRLLNPSRIFEFGTFDGRTTLHLAMNAPDDAEVYTLDIGSGSFKFGADTPHAEPVTVGQHFINSAMAKKIRMLTGDSHSFDFSPFQGRIDLVFIDADHSYEAVMNDSRKAFEMVRPNGMIVWHDYLMEPEVTRAIIELGQERKLVALKGTSLVLNCQFERGL